MYYCALSLGVLEHTPQIYCLLCDLVCFEVQFSHRKFLNPSPPPKKKFLNPNLKTSQPPPPPPENFSTSPENFSTSPPPPRKFLNPPGNI